MNLFAGLHDIIHQPVLLGGLGIHPEVAVGVVLQAVDQLSGVLGQDFVHQGAQLEKLLRLHIYIGGGRLRSPPTLSVELRGGGPGPTHTLRAPVPRGRMLRARWDPASSLLPLSASLRMPPRGLDRVTSSRLQQVTQRLPPPERRSYCIQTPVLPRPFPHAGEILLQPAGNVLYLAIHLLL